MGDQDIITTSLDYARENLEEALDLIVPDEKAAYAEAMQRVPDLVETESDPTIFLKYNSFNAWGAARNLISYWSERKRVFGDRAFLPLNFTEGGALSNEALNALRGGAFQLLPNDSHGRNVILMRQKIVRYLSPTVHIQILFFLAIFTMRNPSSSKKEIILLSLCDTVRFSGDRKEVIEAIQDALPMDVHSWHFIYENSTPGTSFVPMVYHILNGLVASWHLKRKPTTKVYVHTYKELQDCATDLNVFGITPGRLPTILGGSWKTVSWNELGNSFVETALIRSMTNPANYASPFCDDTQPGFLPAPKRQSVLEINDFLTKINNEPEGVLQEESYKFDEVHGNQDPLKSPAILPDEGVLSHSCLENDGTDEAFQDTIGIFSPTNRDVISGKGGSNTQHNAFFVDLCREYVDEYETTKKRGMAGKRGLAMKIVRAVHANNGRFLKQSQDGDGWEELSDQDASRKVAHCMRDLVYKRNKKGRK